MRKILKFTATYLYNNDKYIITAMKVNLILYLFNEDCRQPMATSGFAHASCTSMLYLQDFSHFRPRLYLQ
jgi:hypothetical protein